MLILRKRLCVHSVQMDLKKDFVNAVYTVALVCSPSEKQEEVPNWISSSEVC